MISIINKKYIDKNINLNHILIYCFVLFFAVLNAFVVLFNLSAAISRLLALKTGDQFNLVLSCNPV